MTVRRTPLRLLAAVAALAAVTGCGSQAAPGAAPASPTPTQIPGTRPSTADPSRSWTDAAPTATGTAPGAEVTPSPRDLRQLTVTDQHTGDYVSAATMENVTFLEIGIHGVGLVWPVQRATVRRTPTGTALRYSGRGRLDPRARLTLPPAAVPIGPATSAHTEPIRLRVVAQVAADGLGRADVWIDGRHHVVGSHEPPHTADPVVRVVVGDFARGDWADLYDHSVRLPGLSRAAFVRLLGGDGGHATLRTTGPISYRLTNGVAFADVPVHVDGVLHRRPVHRDGTLQLVYQRGAWRYSTITATSP